MRGLGVIAAIMLLALPATACQSQRRDIALDASPVGIQRSLDRSFVRYVVENGDWVFVEQSQDFGDAICGANICVRKSEIRSIHWTEGGGYAPSFESVLAAPFVAVAMFGMIQPTASGGGKHAAPTVAELMPGCAASSNPAPSSRALTSEQGLAEWAWENQRSVSLACLAEAAARLTGDNRKKGVDLFLQVTARGAWMSARCKDAVIGRRLTLFRSGEKAERGATLIARAREIIADPATYSDAVSPDFCKAFGGVAPESEWDARKLAVMQRLDPFSRESFVRYGAMALNPPAEDDPHPQHNRRLPPVLFP